MPLLDVTPVTYGWRAIIPSLGAFIGGISLPYAPQFENLLGGAGPITAITLGCAVGAAVGDFLLHLIGPMEPSGNNLVSFSVTIKRMAMDALYAGIGALLGVLGVGLITDSEVTIQYLASAISGFGLYYMGFRMGW